MRYIFVILFLSLTAYCTENIKIESMLEKIKNSSNPDEKKALLEKLKERLASENLKARKEADAIIKAKEKTPSKAYDESFLSK